MILNKRRRAAQSLVLSIGGEISSQRRLESIQAHEIWFRLGERKCYYGVHPDGVSTECGYDEDFQRFPSLEKLLSYHMG